MRDKTDRFENFAKSFGEYHNTQDLDAKEKQTTVLTYIASQATYFILKLVFCDVLSAKFTYLKMYGIGIWVSICANCLLASKITISNNIATGREKRWFDIAVSCLWNAEDRLTYSEAASVSHHCLSYEPN